jgi:hypothetical protein
MNDSNPTGKRKLGFHGLNGRGGDKKRHRSGLHLEKGGYGNE